MKTFIKMTLMFCVLTLLAADCGAPSGLTRCEKNQDKVLSEGSFKSINYYQDGPRESLYTEDADKECHAKMDIDVVYPMLIRVYKADGKREMRIERFFNIKQHIDFEFGTVFGWFPVFNTYESERETLLGKENGVFRMRCDQAAKNNTDEYVWYRTEVWLKQSYKNDEVYQFQQQFQLSEAEIDQKFAELPDWYLDENAPEDWINDERYYFKIFEPAFYTMLPKEE